MAEYIDRAVVKKHLDECAADDMILRDYRDACIALSVYVEMLPAADVQPVKRGHWELIGGQESWLQGYTCSECGQVAVTYECNFCPNCGADMRQESNR